MKRRIGGGCSPDYDVPDEIVSQEAAAFAAQELEQCPPSAGPSSSPPTGLPPPT
jgi:hypothetical protein